MVPKDLRSFLDDLDRAGELVRIKEPLAVKLEIAEVADRVMKMPGGGPGLLIQNPSGYDMPVAINTMGSERRMAIALGVGDVQEIADEIEDLLKPEVPASFADKLALLKKAGRIAGSAPFHFCTQQLALESVFAGAAQARHELRVRATTAEAATARTRERAVALLARRQRGPADPLLLVARAARRAAR